MEIDQVLERLGGVASRAVLVRATSRRQFDTAVRRGDLVRDAYGRYSSGATAEASRVAGALTGVLSHRSAALHWGWEVKTLPPLPEVTVRRKRHLVPGRADAVELHRADLTPAQVVGVATSVERTLFDCCRALPFDEALAVADSALRHRAVTRRELGEIAGSVRGPGAPQARRVAREATHLAANPFESVLRAIALDVRGLDVRAQAVIRDSEGSGRPDLVDESQHLVLEAESHSWHSRRGVLRRDCRRYTHRVLLGWRVLRFAWEDVMFEPEYVRDCLERAVRGVSRQAGSADKKDRAA